MVKFFESQYKYNWVSDEGQFIGYSRYQNCCENFGYYYVSELYEDFDKIIDEENHNKDLEELIESNESDIMYKNELKFGKLKVFRDESAGFYKSFVAVEILKEYSIRETIMGYLVLYNCHNGYYSHGFDFNLKPDKQYDTL